MGIATFICYVSFGYVVWTVDPEVTNWAGFALFYACLFLALTGTFALIGFLIRFIAMKRELVFRSVRDAFRQSFLFSFIIIAALYLLSRNLFNWLNIILLAVGLSVFEFFLISYSKNRYDR
jgi:hypothetical protein